MVTQVCRCDIESFQDSWKHDRKSWGEGENRSFRMYTSFDVGRMVSIRARTVPFSLLNIVLKHQSSDFKLEGAYAHNDSSAQVITAAKEDTIKASMKHVTVSLC